MGFADLPLEIIYIITDFLEFDSASVLCREQHAICMCYSTLVCTRIISTATTVAPWNGQLEMVEYLSLESYSKPVPRFWLHTLKTVRQ
jgi:hypothetical protein